MFGEQILSGFSGTEGQLERNCSVGKDPVPAVQTDTLASQQPADNSSPPPPETRLVEANSLSK